MSFDPFQNLLGVPSSADDATLLGLRIEELSPLAIDNALHERLSLTFQHTDGRSDEAEAVRKALRAAAGRLKAAVTRSAAARAPASRALATREGSTILFNLTAFDRMVLGVLVGCGGWNSQSRARLIALAATHGVSAQGLLRVIHGLGDYARRGGPRLNVREMAFNQPPRNGTRTPPVFVAPATSAAPPVLDQLTENMSAELKRGDPWLTIKLSALFAIATIVLGIVIVRLLIISETNPAPKSSDQPARIDHEPVATASAPGSSTQRNHNRIARFPRTPTFLGNAMPIEAVNAAQKCAELPAIFESISTKLTINQEPAEAVYRDWEYAIHTLATGWVLADLSTRNQLEKAIVQALRSCADRPSVSDRMLRALSPANAVSEPLDIWRGCWQVHALAGLSASRELSPVVIERARATLEVALVESLRGAINSEEAAREWLRGVARQLIANVEFDQRAYDFWELWIRAQRALGRGDSHDAAVMHAIDVLLKTGTDLSRPGPSVNVLARLVELVLERPSHVVKQKIPELFDAELISTRDLWVLTSLIAMSDAAPWFPDNLVLPDDADERHRWRVRDDLAAAWPVPAGNPASAAQAHAAALKVDPELAKRWIQAANVLLAEQAVPRGRFAAESVMRKIIETSRVIEAADALAAHNLDAAAELLGEAPGAPPHSPSTPSTSTTPPTAPGQGIIIVPPTSTTITGTNLISPGQPIGRDGDWANQYQQAGRSVEDRMQLLQSLRTNAGTDLGPVDGEVFTRLAYFGSPAEIRALAQTIAAEQFANGPIVIMLLLDQFADAPRNQGVSEMIQTITGQLLPNVRSASWAIEARLALVNHALALRPDGRSEIESFTEQLIDSYVGRLTHVRRDSSASAAPRTPQEAAALLAQAWLDKAALEITYAPTPDTLPGMQRRSATRMRLADGPIQQFAAHQLAILDAQAYITVAQQPELQPGAIQLLRQSAQQREQFDHVLEQSLEIERAMLRLWKLRMHEALANQANDAEAT